MEKLYKVELSYANLLLLDGHIRILHKACHERIERGIDVSGDTLETPGGKLPYGGTSDL